MTLSVTTIGDNPQQPGVFAETYIPDQLIAGGLKLVTQPIVLASGTLQRGTVLGQQTNFSVQVTPGTNTGNGTVGSISLGASPDLGAYTLTATGATTFTVKDPEGNALANATVGTAYTSAELNFTITAGGTAFVAGDSFVLNYTNSVGNFIECVRTASDGSQTPVCVLADYADASGGAVRTGAYFMGEFNANALTFDTSWTVPQLTAALASRAIYVKSTSGAYSAADPS